MLLHAGVPRSLAGLAIALTVLAPGVAAQTGSGAQIRLDDQTHVADPNGTVPSIVLSGATARERFYVDVHDQPGSTPNTTRVFEADEVPRGLALNLSPPLSNTTRLVVHVHSETGDHTLALDNATVTVEPRRGAVRIHDQTHVRSTGEGVRWIELGVATANVPTRLSIEHGNGTPLANLSDIDANEVLEGRLIELSPPLSATATVTGTLTDEVTGRVLDTADATVTVVDPEASLVFEDQAREIGPDGEVSRIVVQRAEANTAFYLDAHAPGVDGALVESPRFAAGGLQENVTLDLQPGLASATPVTVGLHLPDGTELANATATVTPAPASDEPTGPSPGAGTPGIGAGPALLCVIIGGLAARRVRRS